MSKRVIFAIVSQTIDQNRAEQPALVLFQAGYGQIVVIVVQLEVVFAQPAFNRLKVVFDGGIADVHLVAEIVGVDGGIALDQAVDCLLYTSPSPRD